MSKLIATWRMAYESLAINAKNLEPKSATQMVVDCISFIEDCPYYQSVGYGGLPNQDGIVEQDAAFMNGETLAIGAVMGVKNLQNPIKVAQKLSLEKYNNFLTGLGAEKYATYNGFEFKNMLSLRAKAKYEEKKKKIDLQEIQPYDGHDTVGIVALDNQKKMAVGTSTSGLFFKKEGRVGDSPFAGSGFYCDQEIGGCAATGLGEDIVKGILSFAIVEKMGTGLTPQQACDRVFWNFVEKLKQRNGRVGGMSVIAMNQKGDIGVVTNVDFTFCTMEDKTVKVYHATPNLEQKNSTYVEMKQKEIDDYLLDRGFEPNK